MSGELQSIPARHGVATFVPKGQTIKIVNTYGRQVVDTWVFALPKPPNKKEIEEEDKQTEGEAKKAAEEAAAQAQAQKDEDEKVTKGNDETGGKAEEGSITEEKSDQQAKEEEQEENAKGEQEAETEEETAQKESENTEEKGPEIKSKDDDDEVQNPSKAQDGVSQAQKKGWSSYIPSIRRGKQPANTPETNTEKSPDTPKKRWSVFPSSSKANATDADNAEQDAANSKTWSSYFPSGKGFSNYLPSKEQVSNFTSMHQRDPTKSIAEQLYDFSKTPVGAASLSAATGSGYSSSLYAAYSAYTKLPRHDDSPPMEYLSVPHTRAIIKRLVPKPDDTLISNLDAPLMTITEDTTAGIHDTLMPACDSHYYRNLDVKNWEEHGSCAENLVLALKELNEKAGLKGPRAVGADITVNIAPAPLHLFMNSSITSDGTVKVEEPKGPKRSHIKLKAERDVVVVMSACPDEKGPTNAKKCMAANFVVEEATSSGKEEEKSAEAQPKKGKATPSSKDEDKKTATDKETEEEKEKKTDGPKPPVEKKKPKKLERRGGAGTPTRKQSSAPAS